MRNVLWIIFAYFLVSCHKLELDGLAFPSEKLSSYQFEKYTNGEIAIPDSMKVDQSNRTLVEMISYDAATDQSYKIYGVYIGDLDSIAQDSVILYLHGQSKHMDHYFTRATLLANLENKHHYGVFMIDYRGYGMSEGKSTEGGLYTDVNTAINWLKNQGVKDEKTIVYGFSLGAIPAIDRIAFRGDFSPAKLIIESPLASVDNLVNRSTVLGVDPDFVTTLEFNNAEKIKFVTTPLLWFHGKEDTYIEIQNGELIYQNHGGVIHQAVRVEDSDHSEIPQVMGYKDYLGVMEKFIRK